MRTGTVSYKVDDLRKSIIIPIGFVGENDFTRVIFDAEEIYKNYPAAQVSMKVQPPKGGIYPATVTKDGNNVIWQVKAADVAQRGSGELQLTFTDGETKIKTYIARTDVKRSLAGNGPAPDPVQDWIDDAEEVLDDLAAMDNIAKTAEDEDIGKALSPKTIENGVVTEWQYVEPGGGTEDYDDLDNKPSIAGVTLAGDKSLHDLGIAAESAIPDVSGKANLSVVAPTFDQATANDAGSLVTYTDGVVYVLPEGHTAGTTWANTQKTATNIAEQQRLIKTAIQGIIPLEPKDIMSAQIGRNLFNKYTAKSGYYVNKDNGELVANSSYFASDFIEVEQNTAYGVNITGHFAWYTSDKTYISGGSSTNTLTSPATAKFIKIDGVNTDLDNLMLCKGIARLQNDRGFPYEVLFPWLKAPASVDAFALDKYGATVVNMFNKHTATDGQYVDHSDGVFRGSGTYFRSDYIPVKPNTEYTVSEPNRYAVYDSNYQYITGANLGWNVHTFTTPNNAAYVVICGTPVASKDGYIIAETANYPASYESYGVVVPWIKPKVAKSKYDGKTLVCFGDSITYSDYTGTIEADTGMTVINQGYSSARWAYAEDASSTVNAFAMHELIKALTTGDYTTPNTIIGVTGYESQAAQLAALKLIDFTKVDLVSFALGTNDFSSATPLDNPSNPYDTEYVKGAVRYCIKTLLTAYPHLKIICATPCYRFWIENGVIVDDCDTHQIGGMLLKDVCEAIEEASTDCHVPYVNNLKNAGINAFNRTEYYYTTDGLHPNPKGRAILGHRIGAAILEQF